MSKKRERGRVEFDLNYNNKCKKKYLYVRMNEQKVTRKTMRIKEEKWIGYVMRNNE